MKLEKTMATLVLLMLATCVWGADQTKASNAQSAFAQFKALAGTWETTTRQGNKARASYEITAAGSAVLERFEDPAMGPGNEMVTVYYLDGARLLLTHYCMAKNQPRMQASQIDREAGQVKFDFVDATGLSNAEAGHMHSAKFHFVDANHFTTEWQFFEGGKPKFAETAEYTRVQ